MASDFTRIARKLNAMTDEMGLAMGSGLRVAGELIMTDVKASAPGHGVPVDTGALRASGRVQGPTGFRTPKVTLSFGGPSAPYAVRQHEDLTYYHDVGEARYLVRGVERFAAKGLGQAEAALKKNAHEALLRIARRP